MYLEVLRIRESVGGCVCECVCGEGVRGGISINHDNFCVHMCVCITKFSNRL
jgi:hypothetical protein